MEPEDLPWPGELEEEEEEEAEAGNLEEDEVVMVEEMEEEERREPGADFHYESQRRESTDDEDDEEAKAWLQAHPGGALPQASLPRHRYSESELTSPGKVVPLTCHLWQQPLYQNNSGTQISDTNVASLENTAQCGSGDDQRTESWQCLPQEMDSSYTLDTAQTGFNVREKGNEVTDFASLEEGLLTQSGNQGKEPNRDLLCSPLLVLQDNFASPDLPLLTCLTEDQEFGPDSLFHQSELDFAPLRGIPGKSEDTEWFSRPSEVSETLFQAASGVASDLVSSCFSISQHPLTGSTAVKSQRSLLTPEQGTKEETVPSNTIDDLKTCKDSGNYDAVYSYMSWETREVIQEPATNLVDKDQVSFSTASDISDEYINPKGSDSFDASYLYAQYGNQGTLPQSEKYLAGKDHDSYSDSSDTIDRNKIPKESDNFSFSNMPWSKQEASHHPEIYLISKDHVFFPHEVAPHFNNKMLHSFLHCLLGSGGSEVPLMSDSHYFESVCLRANVENEVKQKVDSLESYKRNEEDLGKGLSQCFELKENRNTSVFSEVHPRSSEIQYIENVVVPDNSVEVSEAHILSRGLDTSTMEISGGPLQTIKSNSIETSEQLYFQEERNQKATSVFDGENVDATENVAFQAVIASIEPSEKESTVNEIQTDINKSLTNDSQESEPKSPDPSLLNYDENFFFDKLNHPRYQSTPGVFQSGASKPLSKKDNGDSSLYWRHNLKSIPSAPQEIFIKPLSLSSELKSSSSLSEESLRQAIGLGKTRSTLFQYGIDNEQCLPMGKIKSVSALDLAEKLGSSDIIYPMKGWTSDSLVLQDLKQHTFEEVADSSNCVLGKNVNSSHIIEGPSAAVESSFSANLVACDAESQGALPVSSNAPLIAFGQKTLLKADTGQGETPQPLGAKSSFTIHTIMQNDSCFVEGLQGKAESDVCTLDDDIECCSVDENAVVCSKRQEICDQGDSTGECVDLAGLENLLDDLEICDSSLHWQSTVQLPSKEDSSFEDSVCPSNMDMNESFSSVLPPFVPHEPTRDLEYHSSNLRMLRVSPDTVSRTLRHLTGDTSKGGIAEIPQSTFKPGITTSPEDSDTVSHLSLSPEDFAQLARRSPQVKNVGEYTDPLNQQTVADSHLTEETLKISATPGLADQKPGIAAVSSSSYSQRGKPDIFYPQALPDSHLTEEALKVGAVPRVGDQKTGISTVPPSSYSLGEKPSIFYPQALPDGHQTEEPLNVSVLPGLADQKTGKPVVPAGSYSVGEEPGIFYHQVLPDSQLPEEALKVLAPPRPVDEKIGLPTLSSTYSYGEKPHIFYQQTLPDSHPTEQTLKVSAAPGLAEQKTGVSTVTSTSYPNREKPSIFYQPELSNRHLIQKVHQVSAAPGFVEQKAGIATVPSTSYSHREKPSVVYQQELPDSHLIQEVQQVSAAPGLAEQKTGVPTIPFTSYSRREKSPIFYQQELPDSHLIQEVRQVSAAPGLAEQKTGIPTVSSASYSLREKPSIVYQQELSDSQLIEQAQKVASAPGLAEQKTGVPTIPFTSYSRREKPPIFYQQELPDSHLIQEVQQVSAAPGLAEQKTGIPIIPSVSYLHREKSSIFYQQELPDSHLTQEVQQVSAAAGPLEQKTGIPTVPSTSYSHREKPHIFYHQELPESRLTEQAQKVSSVPGLAEQKTGIPTVASTSSSHREKPSILYQQELPDIHVIHQVPQVSSVPGLAEQKARIPVIPSTSYSNREKPSVLYQQELPASHLTEQVQKASAAPGPLEQKTGIPIITSASYSHREKPSIFYQQDLPDSHLTKEAQKVPAVSGLAHQRSRILIAPPAFYSHRGKTHLFYQQELPDSHISDQTQKISAVPGPVDQTVPSSSYSYREKPITFYQQELPGRPLTEEVLKVSALPRTADQNTGIIAGSSRPYLFGEKPSGLFYQQVLPDGSMTEEALKVSLASRPSDQKTGILLVPASSYSHREKPGVFYPQALPSSHLSEETLKDSAVPGPADQRTAASEPPGSYSHREKSSLFYQQELPDSHTTGEALKVSGVSGTGDQKTGIPIVTSPSYSQKEKPIVIYQQAFPDTYLTEEALSVSDAPARADQKTGIPIVTSPSYSYIEKPIIFYQQALPDSQLTVEALKVSDVPGPSDQKTGIPTAPPSSYSYREKPIVSYQQELQDLTQVALRVLEVPGPADQKNGIPPVTSASYSYGEKPIISYQQELPDANEDALKGLGVPRQADQTIGVRIVPPTSYSHRESPIFSYQQELPDLTEEALKVFALPGPADQNAETAIGPSSSYSHKEKLKVLPDDQKTELPSTPSGSYSNREKPKTSSVIGPADQKTPLLTGFPDSYSQRVKPSIVFQQRLADRHQSGDILKISPVAEPIDENSRIPIPLSSSSSHREKSNIFYPQELPDKHLSEDSLKVSTVPGPADKKTVLPAIPPSSFSHREKPAILYHQDFPERHLTEDNLKFSSSRGQADQINGLTVPPGTYSHSEKHRLVSDHVQRLTDNVDSSNTSVISSNMPLNSEADGRVVINKPESSGFEDIRSEEIRDAENSSKTLKEIQTLLMEAENIALRRYNFPAPLVPFRDVSDISFIQSKKMVCFKEPLTTDDSNDLSQRQPFTEESPSSKCIQRDISTQTNLKCQRGVENWEFISSTTVRSPLQEAESKARVAFDETLKHYKAARSVMRSEPEEYSRTIGNKIVIPMMTIIKSDSSSDTSSCSWDSNSLESVSDVLLNFFPCSSPKTSMTDSREEEGVLESDDGGGSSVDSLAAHVKNLLKCESSLNHAKQILKNAEEEESRVRARAWNLKFNMAHEYGYSISELNEDDRRKVEEIKAKLFGHGRTTDLSKDLRSPRGIGCKPEAVCSHIIIESHEKGCFRTLTAERPRLDSHPCVFRSAEPSEITRGQWSPSSWRTRHINLSKSLDQNNSQFKVWNSLQLQNHSPFQNFISDDLEISKGLRMPFHEKLDPWLSELVEPACMPPEEMDCHSSSQMLPPEPMKKFTTSITFSSHRHSKCFSDSSFLKVGVTEGSQCSGASVGVVNSHFTEEQNPSRDLKQRTSSPSSFKIISQSPDKAVTILAENSSQSQKLSVEHSYQEEKPLETSDFKSSHPKPSTSGNDSNFKEVHFSDNHTLISMGRPNSTVEVKEKNVTITADLPSHIFLEQEVFEQSRAPHADHHVRKHPSPPPQHQDSVAPNLPCRIFLEKRELFKQSKAPHVDELRENHSPLPQSQDYITSDLPSSIFLEQRQLFEQSRAPNVDHLRKLHSPLPQSQDCVGEKSNEHKPKLHISDVLDVEAKFSDVVSQSVPNQCTVVTSASTPPSNRKAISCIRITLCPKTPSKLDSGNLDTRFHSLDPASKTRMNSEFNSDLQAISSRSLEPTSKLLISKPVAQNQESLGFLGPKSSSDFQVVQSPLPDSNVITQDLKTIPYQNSQIVTSRQTQVNSSDLEEYSNPEGAPVSADRSPEEIKTLFSPFSGKLSSDAVTQITTESPGKATFSSEIFVNAEDRGHEVPELNTQKLGKVPVKFASSSAVQQITVPHGTDGQPLLLPYKPSGSTKMYYVPQLTQVPSSMDSKSDTTIESSHSGSNDAIAPDFPAQVLGTRDDDLADTVNIKHKEGIYSKRAVTKASLSMGKKPFQKDNADAQVQVLITGDEDLSDKTQKKEIYTKKAVTKTAGSEEKQSLQKDTTGSSADAASQHSTQPQDTKSDSLPDTKAMKQKEEIHSKRKVPKEAWSEEKKSLQIDFAESRCRSEFENTTHSVFRSAEFYFHHPVHLSSDQDFCHESLGRSVFMKHSWKDFFQHHPDKQREYTCLPPPCQNVEKTKTDYTRIESLSINVNLENKELKHATKSQARDFLKSDKQTNDLKRDPMATPELTTEHTMSLNELWNRYQERQKQQKPSEFSAKKELSLVERLDRLAKLLQHPITHSLQPSESTQDDSRGNDVKEWSDRQQQQKNKLQKKKRYKSLEKCHKNTGDLKKNKIISTHQAGRSNQIKIEQFKFDKYILRKQPGFHYINNTSSDSRHSEDSELLTDTATNILSTTTSPVESDILTQTDKEVTLHERSSSISTIDTARLIHAFGHERVCLSPRRIKLYSSITDHQRRYLEKRSKKNKKALNTGYPQITSEHTRRKHIQVTDHISSDSGSSCTSSFWSSNSTLCNKQNVHMLNKGIQAGNLEIVNGVRKNTRDVGMIFPTPSSSEARVEEDSDVTSWSEEKIEEKRLLTSYLGDKKLKKNKSCSEGVSWFVPVENMKSGPKKENMPRLHGPGVCWFAPITKTKPWREPLREQNWQGQHMNSHSSPAGPGRDPLKPFVRATLQESLQLHRPDFISRSGERIKRLKLIVQERKLQNMLQSEREALFNTVQEWQGYQDPMRLLCKRGFLAAQKKRPIGKKEMIQRSKRIYEQLPEVQKKREEEKRRSEYKSYRLRAQLYKKKVTNQLLGRKVPWD